MKLKTILKSILGLVFLVGLVGAGFYFLVLPQINKNDVLKTVTDSGFGWKFPVAKFPAAGSKNLIAYSNIRDPGGIPQGLPVRLKIPSIGVDTAIEDALITPDGRMDVPAGSINVAWFALGPHPGKEGSAVIGGHFGIDNGKPKVFYRLSELGAGAKIYIVDDRGETLAFVVRSIKLFNRDADATTVFTSSDGIAHLNLITCEGVWNQVNDTYPDRRVVFTDSIPSEGAVAVATKPPVVKPALPKTAIAKPIPTPRSTPMLTALPTSTPEESIVTSESKKSSMFSPQILIASAKNLYATPIDGIVTSILLFSILLIAFKLIRR